MIYWVIKISIISIIFILIVHNILHFLRDTLTIPKIRDLVHAPNEKYERIYNIINTKDITPYIPEQPSVGGNGTTPIDSIPTIPMTTHTSSAAPNPIISSQTKQTMKDELKNFMKSHIEKPVDVAPQYMAF